jgi:hypothetical protein
VALHGPKLHVLHTLLNTLHGSLLLLLLLLGLMETALRAAVPVWVALLLLRLRRWLLPLLLLQGSMQDNRHCTSCCAQAILQQTGRVKHMATAAKLPYAMPVVCLMVAPASMYLLQHVLHSLYHKSTVQQQTYHCLFVLLLFRQQLQATSSRDP